MPVWPPVDAFPAGAAFPAGPGEPGGPARSAGPQDETRAGAPLAPQAAMMRASHADRERTTDVLKAAFAEGRLTAEEYNERVEQVYQAQTYGELSAVVGDLPSGPMPVPYLTPAPFVPPAFAAQPYPQPYPQPYAAPYSHGLPYPHAAGQPYPPQYGYPYPLPYGPPYPYPGPAVRRTNGVAVAALILGVAEVWTLGLTAVPALICGHVARAQIRERRQEGSGMATAGIVLGWLAVAFWVLVILGTVALSHGSATTSGG